MPMPLAVGVGGVAQPTGSPAMQDPPGVRLVDAGQDLHQRRLAGAVLADQPDDLAAADLDRDVLQRMHAGEALVDALERQRGGRRSLDDPHACARSIESATAAMIIRPCTACLDARAACPSAPCRWRARRRSARRPASAARRPAPPESAVPPTTTAVTVVNSRPWPICALPRPSCAAARMPPSGVEDAGDGEGGDAHAARPGCRRAPPGPRRRRARRCSGRAGCGSGSRRRRARQPSASQTPQGKPRKRSIARPRIIGSLMRTAMPPRSALATPTPTNHMPSVAMKDGMLQLDVDRRR